MSQEIDSPLSKLGQGWNCDMSQGIVLMEQERPIPFSISCPQVGAFPSDGFLHAHEGFTVIFPPDGTTLGHELNVDNALKVKKTVIMVFLCPLCRQAFQGTPSSGRIQAADCLFVSGSKVAIQVSSVVITLAKNSPGLILIGARLSSHSCLWKAFCSSVSMWGTMQAQRCQSLRSFFTMFQTVPLDKPLAAESHLTLLLLSALMSP